MYFTCTERIINVDICSVSAIMRLSIIFRGEEMKRLRNQPAKNLMSDILYRLDCSGKTDQEKLDAIKKAEKILKSRIIDKNSESISIK